MFFSESEIRALGALERELPQKATWPEGPLTFVLNLAPRTRGKLGESLIQRLARDLGLATERPKSVAYDIEIDGQRCEVKFSTEDPPRFQQVRDPRLDEAGSIKYDYLICVSGRPDGLVYWLFPAKEVAELMDEGYITIQHAMSDTKWFLPSRTATDSFAGFRVEGAALSGKLRGL